MSCSLKNWKIPGEANYFIVFPVMTNNNILIMIVSHPIGHVQD